MHRSTDLAKPTPRLTPCASRSMRVEMTCPKGLRRFSSSCSSMDTGRLDRYRLVGSCSCCCNTKWLPDYLQGPQNIWLQRATFQPLSRRMKSLRRALKPSVITHSKCSHQNDKPQNQNGFVFFWYADALVSECTKVSKEPKTSSWRNRNA